MNEREFWLIESDRMANRTMIIISSRKREREKEGEGNELDRWEPEELKHSGLECGLWLSMETDRTKQIGRTKVEQMSFGFDL
jgi:hypothetical protein